MDQRESRKHRKISKDHTKDCSKCGLPSREGCRFQGCNEVKHCACQMT